MITKRKFTKSELEKLLKTKSYHEIARLKGCSVSTVKNNAEFYGLKSQYKQGFGPTKIGDEVLDYVAEHGPEKAAKFFKKEFHKIKSICWNGSFAGKRNALKEWGEKCKK